MVMGLTPKGWVDGEHFPKSLPCDDCKKQIDIQEWDQCEEFQRMWDTGFLCRDCQFKFMVDVAENGY